MRKALDAVYGAALICACLAMAAIASLVFLQVAGRAADRAAVLLGAPRLGFAIPSLAEIGGFLFVAAVFLALPAAMRSAGHVRVTLLLRGLGPASDRLLTALVLVVALGLACFAAWSVGAQTLASYQRGSVSFGLVPIPLWIPQMVMTTGLTIFAVALLDELLAIATGGEAAFRQAERNREVTEGGH